MQITSIKIQPHDESDAGQSRVKATAEIVLNDSLSLRGIKIMRGKYGLFLAFPGLSASSPYRVFETLSLRFRLELQVQVLKAYRTMMNQPVSLFG